LKTKACILVVDDRDDELLALARLLALSGYDVRLARSVGEAVAVASGAEPLDLLVSDVGLPDGNGRDLMRQLRARLGLKGIAVSGYATTTDARRSRAAGFDRHLNKPLVYEDLLKAITDVLAKAAQAPVALPAADLIGNVNASGAAADMDVAM
jgi:CheY-like chemotaxis protein